MLYVYFYNVSNSSIVIQIYLLGGFIMNLTTLKNLVFDKDFRFVYLGRKEFYNNMPDEKYLKKKYKCQLHKDLDLENPLLFNEKLQWLKLYNRKPEFVQMVDKNTVKDYVAERIGEDHIIPTLGIYDKFEDIDFDKLPEKFVIKCTHDSASTFVCSDRRTFDFKKTKKRINKCLKRHYYMLGREWPYKYVEPKIIIEKFMVDESGTELKDYKFFCFNGKVKCFSVDFNRFTDHRANYYSPDFELLDIGKKLCPPDPTQKLNKPEHLEEMITIAEKLSSGHPFLRVDLYNINGHIYFGELTFYPASGFSPFLSDEQDRMLGDWLILPDKDIDGKSVTA